jgi:hypothetical protein
MTARTNSSTHTNMRDKLPLTIPDDARKQAKAFFDERAADLGALCHHEEFQYWPATARRRK